MDFDTSVRTCFQKYFVFSGRATRSEYWWFYLFTIIGSVVLGIVDGMVFGWENEIDPISSLFSLAVLIPTLAVASRRLHDIDRSGWWQLLPLGVGLLIAIFFGVSIVSHGSLEEAMSSLMMVVAIIAGIILIGSLILLIIWWATKGTEGPNRYGEDPFDYEYD